MLLKLGTNRNYKIEDLISKGIYKGKIRENQKLLEFLTPKLYKTQLILKIESQHKTLKKLLSTKYSEHKELNI